MSSLSSTSPVHHPHAAPSTTLWRSRWDSLKLHEVVPERPNSGTTKVLSQLVEWIMEQPQLNSSRFAVLCGKAAESLVEHQRSRVVIDGASRIEDDLPLKVKAAFSHIKYALDDVGMSAEDGRDELALYVSLRLLKHVNNALELPISSEELWGLIESLFEKLSPSMCPTPRGLPIVDVGTTTKEITSDGGGKAPWEKIDLTFPEEGPWKVPSPERPWPLLKAKLYNKLSLYGLKGKNALLYVLRNFGGGIKEELETFVKGCEVGGKYDPDTTLRSVVEYLDAKYKSQYSESQIIDRWEKLSQLPQERVSTFCGRIEMEGEFRRLVSGQVKTDADKSVRLLKGLRSSIRELLEKYVGPRLHTMTFAEIRDHAEFYDEKVTTWSGSKGKGRRTGGLNPSSSSSGDLSFKGAIKRVDVTKSDFSQRKCWQCGEVGHIGLFCPTVTCYSCGRKGHMSKVCKQQSSGSGDHSKKAKDKSSKAVEQEADEVKIFIGEIYSVNEADACPVLECHMGERTDGVRVECLLDSGAACSLISGELARKLASNGLGRIFNTEKPIKLSYVGGSSDVSKSEIIIPTYVKSRASPVFLPFVIIENMKSKGDREIILGRSALCDLNVTLQFKGSSKRSARLKKAYSERNKSSGDGVAGEQTSEKMPESNCIRVRIDYVTKEPFVIPDDFDEVEEPPSPNPTRLAWMEKRVAESLPRHPPAVGQGEDRLNTYAVHCLKAVAKEGWIPISQGYEGRLIDADHEKLQGTDNNQQRFQVQLRWRVNSEDVATMRRPWNSQRLINKLTPQQRRDWDAEIAAYQNKQWWFPTNSPPPITS